MADVKWIKITTDIFSDEKIMLIEQMPEADTLLVIWFKMLCMAGRDNNNGIFLMNNRIPYTEEMFATLFRRPLNTVRLAISTFEAFGMIDIIDNVVTVVNWEKHQNIDGLERIKELNRARQARFKERKKQKLLESNVIGNVEVTEGNAIEEDKEKEKDKEREKEKKSVRETTRSIFERLVPDYNIPEDLQSKISDWITYKTERKEPYKEQGMKSLLKQIENNYVKYGSQAVCDLIDECMASNWKGIIFDRLKQQTGRQNGHNNTAQRLDEAYGMMAAWAEGE